MEVLKFEEMPEVTGGVMIGCGSGMTSGQYQTLAAGYGLVATAGFSSMGLSGPFGFGVGMAGTTMGLYNLYCSW